MQKPEFVFVYGTLKRGYGNGRRCLGTSTFIGEAISVNANFEMQHVGFPILWEVSEGGAKVIGEIFLASPEDMMHCDQLEGHPRMYKREKRQFMTSDGKTDWAWVYLWQGQHYGGPIDPVDGTLIWFAEHDDYKDWTS